MLVFTTNSGYKYTAVDNTIKEAAESIAEHIEDAHDNEYEELDDEDAIIKKYEEKIKDSLDSEIELDECPNTYVLIESYPNARVVYSKT